MRRVARLLLFVGIVVIVLGFAKVHANMIGHYNWTGSARAGWTVAYIALLAVAAYGAGLPDVPRSARSAIGPAIGAAAGGALAVSAVQLVVGDALLPRFVVAGAAVMVVPWYLVCAAIARSGRERAEDRDRVLVVASLAETEALRAELDRAPEQHATIVSQVSPADAASVRPTSRPLVECVQAERASVVVLDRAALSDESIASQAASLHESGSRIRTLSQFYEEWLGKVPASELERESLFFDIGEVHRAQYSRIKRLLDLVLAIMVLPLFAISAAAILIGNLVGNRGSLFYRQERVGKNGRTFEMLKFRTMLPAAPDVVPSGWTAEDDPRVTPFGRILRRVHVDELPQVINVLRGQLSIVGPRPEQPHYVAELTEKLPFYGMRHLVSPGITGWAQVKYGYARTEQDALEKLQYEFFYLRHQSLGLDVRIIGRTLRTVGPSRHV
jgi:lipopolysaccharide/colanic/teichoic acid biosynthesis glycosyltransferase